MKIGTEKNEVHTTGGGEKARFKIAANRQAFQILSDGLYANKILAIVRELSTNARDSHIDAGKADLPIQVHLPNPIEPWFSVRDFGLGLSHEDIMTVYNSYFESTKTKSNDVTGCLGLGSKSPFSYTDQFTVASCFNGVRRLYNAYIDEDGAPSIREIQSTKTDECNGLEIQVAVETSDFHRFNEAAQKALIRFNPLPEVIGTADFKFNPIKYAIATDRWALRDTNNDRYGYRDRSEAVAIQGAVAYPINTSAMKDLTRAQQMVLEAPLDIQFEIGELMVTASREALSYGDKEPTTNSIKQACDKIIAELPIMYQKEFDDCKSLWEAKIRYHDLIEKAPYGIQSLMQRDAFSIKWKGVEVNSKAIEVDVTNYICKTGSKDNPHIEYELDLRLFERRSRGRRVDGGNPRAYKFESYSGTWKFMPSNTIKVVYNDVGRGAHSRVTHYMLEHDFGDVKRGAIKVLMIEAKREALMKKFIQEMGGVDFIKVSDLPKPPAKVNKTSGTAGVKVHQYDASGYEDREKWKPTSLDFKTTSGIYVAINRYKPFKNDTDMSYKFSEIVEMAIGLGIIDKKTPIYGVYPRYAKKLASDSNWTSLWELLISKTKILVKKEKLAQGIVNQNALQDLNVLGIVQNSTWDKIADSNSPFSMFVDHLNTMRKQYGSASSNTLATRANMANRLLSEVAHSKIETSGVKADHDLKAEWKMVLTLYPMLGVIPHDTYYMQRRNISDRQLVEIITNYINLVDAS